MTGAADPTPPAVVAAVPVLNAANALTALRLLLVPVFAALVVASELTHAGWRVAACLVFALASLTDFVDGWIARRFALVTSVGKVADPIADKALTGAGLVLLSWYALLPWWVTVVILAVSQPFLPPWAGPTLFLTLLAGFGIALWRSAANLDSHVRAGSEMVVEALKGYAVAEPTGEMKAITSVQDLMPGLGGTVAVQLHGGSRGVGKSLADLDLRGRTGATVLAISPGEDTNAGVVRGDTATEFNLASMGDLAAVQDQLKWALPPDCDANPLCKGALEEYGITYPPKQRESLDACTAPLAEALNGKAVDFAWLCSTQPAIAQFGFVVHAA